MSRRDAVLWVGALVLGFLLGGLAGWSQRPTEWQAGIWHTASASVDAATYGHAYESKAERVLLDNFDLDLLCQAVKITNKQLQLEASGGVNLDSILAIAQTGVDFISCGALTKDVKAIDLSMRFI